MIDKRLYPSRALHGQVAHVIGRRIVAGAFAEGGLLPREAELAEEFSISRQAIREALKVLAAKGLVSSRRRTGTVVQPRAAWNLLDPDVLAWHPLERLDPAFIADLVELRRVVEPAAAEFAAQRATEAQIAAIGKALEAMRATVGDGNAFVVHDVAFHVAVSAASGNVLFDRLSIVVEPLLKASLALQVRVRTREEADQEILPGHAAVYNAIAARDPAAARTAMDSLLSAATREVSAIPWDDLAGAGSLAGHAALNDPA